MLSPLASARAAARHAANSNRDSDMSRSTTLLEPDDDSSTDGEERLQVQRQMQMLDLGTSRREYVTTNDKPVPPELRLSKQQLLRSRKVEEEGTEAAKLFQENRPAVNAWNNIGTEIANDNADREQLADLMGGQSHRARLNRNIKEAGGQKYGESPNADFDDSSRRRGRGGGMLGREMMGRSGRGAPMHMAIPRTNGRFPAGGMPSIPTGPKANRPLDPAIDPDREYAYKHKRGGKTFTMSYSGRQPVKIKTGLGHGSTPNDARATMVGSTVRIGPGSEQSEPRPPRVTPVTAALDEQAFLKAMNGVENKPAFNDHIQEKTKPAPSSKAAAMIDQPAKATRKPAASAKQPSSLLPRSTETPAEAFRAMTARALNRSLNVDGNIRLAPTHEFGFPPPTTRSGGRDAHGSGVSVHTDGVESATTFNSADLATQSSGEAHSKLDQTRGTIVIGSPSRDERRAATSEAQSCSDLGIRVLPPASHAEPQQRDDLIALDDDGDEQSKAVADASHHDGLAILNPNSVPSPSIPDLMDEDLDIDIPHTSLTPKSSVAPRFLIYRGARYIRADQMTGQYLEDMLQDTRPRRQMNSSDIGVSDRLDVSAGANIDRQRRLYDSSGGSILGEHNLPGRSQGSTEESSSLVFGDSSRFAVTGGLNIGVQTIQQSSSGSILGEHNLARRSRGSTEASSALALEDSIWNPGNTRRTPPYFRMTALTARPVTSTASHQNSSTSESHSDSLAVQQPLQPDPSSRNLHNGDMEKTNTSATSSAPQPLAATSNLAASKYATADAQVTTAHVPAFGSVGSKNSAESSKSCLNKNTSPPGTDSQDQLMAPASDSDHSRNMTFGSSSETGSMQAAPPRPNADHRTIGPAERVHKTPDLKASKWADLDAELTLSKPSKKNFGTGFKKSSLRSESREAVDGEDDPVVVSQNGGSRKRNPFTSDTRTSDDAEVDTKGKFTFTDAPQPSSRSTRTQRSTNLSNTTPPTLSLDQQILRAMRSGPQAGPATFTSPEPAASKPAKSVESDSMHGAAESQRGESTSQQNKPKPKNDLMASKYATTPGSNVNSSFRKVRRNRSHFDSDESEM